jgi:hypothetical protein
VITATCGGTGIDLYKRIRPEISEARPFWPLGLPAWEDAWLAHGLHGESSTYLAVWRRGPAGRNAAPGSGGGPSPGAWRCRDVLLEGHVDAGQAGTGRTGVARVHGRARLVQDHGTCSALSEPPADDGRGTV